MAVPIEIQPSIAGSIKASVTVLKNSQIRFYCGQSSISSRITMPDIAIVSKNGENYLLCFVKQIREELKLMMQTNYFIRFSLLQTSQKQYLKRKKKIQRKRHKFQFTLDLNNGKQQIIPYQFKHAQLLDQITQRSIKICLICNTISKNSQNIPYREQAQNFKGQ